MKLSESYKNRIQELAGIAPQQNIIENKNMLGQGFFTTLQEDFPYLEKFTLTTYGTQGNEIEVWKMQRDYKGCTFLVTIKHNFIKEIWECTIQMKGSLDQRGKMEIETTTGYEEFKKQVKTKLTNNLLWNFEGFSNNSNELQDVEIIKEIAILMEHGKDLEQVTDPIFNDLKKIYRIAKQYDLKTQYNELIERLLKEFNDNRRKIIFILSLIPRIDYHLSMQNGVNA